MKKTVFEQILEQIATANQVSAGEVREKMQIAMSAALRNPDPAVQAMWNSIPKKGQTPTLDEFMEYLVEKNMLLP